MSLPPASGTGRYFARAAKSIRLIRQGCANRPFFHISVTHVSIPKVLDRPAEDYRLFEEFSQLMSVSDWIEY